MGLAALLVGTANLGQPGLAASPSPAAAVVPTGPLLQARAGHSATLLPDGRVLLVGGSQHGRHGRVRTLDSAEAWDPTTGTFSEAGTLATVRTGHLAVLLGDGSVLIVGGESHDGEVESAQPTFRADLERWDPLTATFGPAGSLTGTDWVDSATVLTDGRVLIVGSGSRAGMAQAELWDPVERDHDVGGLVPQRRRLGRGALGGWRRAHRGRLLRPRRRRLGRDAVRCRRPAAWCRPVSRRSA